MNFILLQSSNTTAVIITLVVFLVLFLVFRGALLWFWKVDKIVENQETQIKQQQIIIEKLDALNVGNPKVENGERIDVLIEETFDPVKKNLNNKTFILLYSSKDPLKGGKFNVLVGDDKVFRNVPIGRDNPLEYEVSAGEIKVLIGASSIISSEKVVYLSASKGMDSYFDVFEYYYEK